MNEPDRPQLVLMLMRVLADWQQGHDPLEIGDPSPTLAPPKVVPLRLVEEIDERRARAAEAAYPPSAPKRPELGSAYL